MPLSWGEVKLLLPGFRIGSKHLTDLLTDPNVNSGLKTFTILMWQIWHVEVITYTVVSSHVLKWCGSSSLPSSKHSSNLHLTALCLLEQLQTYFWVHLQLNYRCYGDSRKIHHYSEGPFYGLLLSLNFSAILGNLCISLHRITQSIRGSFLSWRSMCVMFYKHNFSFWSHLLVSRGKLICFSLHLVKQIAKRAPFTIIINII